MEPARLLQTADRVSAWRWLILIPVAALEIWAPMPVAVRVMLAVITVSLVFGPFAMRVVGRFTVGCRS